MLILALYVRLSMPVSVGVDCDDPHAYTCQVSAGGGWTDVSRELIAVTGNPVRYVTVPRVALTSSIPRYKPLKFSKEQCKLPAEDMAYFDACQ